MIPALLPTSGAVDYSCHLGGAGPGAALFLDQNASGALAEPKPPSVRPALLLSGVLAALTALSVLLTASQYGGYVRREAGLIPDALIPRKLGDADQAADLVSRFPRDPRVYLYQAAADLQAVPAASTYSAGGDSARVAAEQALRTGLAQTDVLDHDMPPQTRDALAATLAGVLADEGRLDEARSVAAPVCAEGSLRMRAIRAKLAQAKLCG